ncbi:MAG: hypothetical protein IIW34_05600, partial [Clostridia bacterium]|nr:hypothetical protein [Clostridia bacterium]
PIFLWGRSCSVIIGLLFIVMFYYTYTGSIGRGCLFVDISLFFASSALTFALSNFICSGFQSPTKTETLLMTGAAALIGILLVMFTFSPPHIPLFRDPLNGSFGIVDTYNTK